MPHTKDDIQKLLTDIADRYIVSKGIIIRIEELDPDQAYNVNIIKELRDTLDHVLIAVVESQKTDQPSIDKAIVQLRKALQHLSRGTFDALDMTSTVLRKEMKEEIEPYGSETTATVIPEYFEMKKRVTEIAEQMTEYRKLKDNGDDKEIIYDVWEKYCILVEELNGFKTIISDNLNNISELHSEKERKSKRKNTNSFVKAVVLMIIGVVLGWFLNSCNDNVLIADKSQDKGLEPITAPKDSNISFGASEDKD